MAVKKTPQDSYGELYIPINEISEKRKSLLLSIKDSLLMQEEYEKVMQIRAKKYEVSKTIKKGLASLNSDYQKVKKLLPNVKNVLSNTEKELNELELQISRLKKENLLNSKTIDRLNDFEDEVKGTPKKEVEVVMAEEKKKAPAKKTKTVKPAPTKPLTKKERVKNNLKVIEAKLKSL